MRSHQEETRTRENSTRDETHVVPKTRRRPLAPLFLGLGVVVAGLGILASGNFEILGIAALGLIAALLFAAPVWLALIRKRRRKGSEIGTSPASRADRPRPSEDHVGFERRSIPSRS